MTPVRSTLFVALVLSCAACASDVGRFARADGGVASVDGGGDFDDGGVSDDGGASSLDAGALDAGTNSDGGAACSASTCGLPGQVCHDGGCITDCRRPGAVACAMSTVCNVSSERTGECVGAGAGCVLARAAVACTGAGGQAQSCGAGTACAPGVGCYAALPCRDIECAGERCWGTSCPCVRPAPVCTPAPIGNDGGRGTLNDPAFTRCPGGATTCGGGLVDLDFDLACNAWGVTTLAGPDYLRRLTPDGGITAIAGVTNLNMGEVAALQGNKGVFGDAAAKGLALTYTCCAACGCLSTPQGVAEWEEATTTLPMRMTAVPTTGSGPFGAGALDTGPFGLSWGLDRVLYVGNLEASGDYHALDLDGQRRARIAQLPQRVYASAPWDRHHMLVATADGKLILAPTIGTTGAPRELTALDGGAVTSVVRDPFSGRGYASIYEAAGHVSRIVSFAADGSGVRTFATSSDGPGRIALARDGFLYHLALAFPASAWAGRITRFELPRRLDADGGL